MALWRRQTERAPREASFEAMLRTNQPQLIVQFTQSSIAQVEGSLYQAYGLFVACGVVLVTHHTALARAFTLMSALFSHAHLWQQEELADVEIVLMTGGNAAEPRVIKVLPGHAAILSNSPYIHAQVRCCHSNVATCVSHAGQTAAACIFQRCQHNNRIVLMYPITCKA